MSEHTEEEIRKAHEDAIEHNRIGFLFAARKLKRFYDILVAEGIPEKIIEIELTAWCQGESRLQVDPMLHQIYAQQHQALEASKE